MANRSTFTTVVEEKLEKYQKQEDSRIKNATDISDDINSIKAMLDKMDSKCEDIYNKLEQVANKAYSRTEYSLWSYAGCENSVYKTFHNAISEITGQFKKEDLIAIDNAQHSDTVKKPCVKDQSVQTNIINIQIPEESDSKKGKGFSLEAGVLKRKY
mgnify:FL=1|tara:strand:- start:846 stop:1316 length:471 start_codon:yes stop_codon:yes gene_type:complete